MLRLSSASGGFLTAFSTSRTVSPSLLATLSTSCLRLQATAEAGGAAAPATDKAAPVVTPDGDGEVHGYVKWYRRNKGFGVIESDAGEAVFVHYSRIIGEGFKSLDAGQRVRFRKGKEEGRKDSVALDIVGLEKRPPKTPAPGAPSLATEATAGTSAAPVIEATSAGGPVKV